MRLCCVWCCDAFNLLCLYCWCALFCVVLFVFGGGVLFWLWWGGVARCLMGCCVWFVWCVVCVVCVVILCCLRLVVCVCVVCWRVVFGCWCLGWCVVLFWFVLFSLC